MVAGLWALLFDSVFVCLVGCLLCFVCVFVRLFVWIGLVWFGFVWFCLVCGVLGVCLFCLVRVLICVCGVLGFWMFVFCAFGCVCVCLIAFCLFVRSFVYRVLCVLVCLFVCVFG